MTQLQQKLNRFQNGAVTVVYFAMKVALSLAAGFLTAKCYLLDDLSPFSLIVLSLSSAIGLTRSGCYIGSCLGYLTNTIDLNVFKYMTALTMVYVIQMIFRKNSVKNDVPFLSGTACFISGFLFLLVNELTLLNVLILIGESILISCCIYFSDYAIQGFKEKSILSSRELIAAAITLMLILSSLHNATVLGLNLSRILALFCIFLAMSCLKTSHVALIGSCLGITMAVVGNGGEAIFTAFIVGSLSACVFLNFSNRFSNVIFLIIYYIVLFFFEKFPWNYSYFAEPFLAFGLISVLPKKKIKEFLGDYIPVRKDPVPAKTELNLSKDVKNFCKASCPYYKKCKYENEERLQIILEELENKHNRITETDLDNELTFCKKKEMLTEFIRKRMIKLDENQLEDIANQLNELSKKLEDQIDSGFQPIRFLEKEEYELKKALTERNLCVKEISFIIDERGLKRCDLQINEEKELLVNKIISECLRPYFEKRPSIGYRHKDDTVYIRAIENEGFEVHCAALCKTRRGETFCGDNALGFSPRKNKYCLILADGMGSGKNACIHSTLVIDAIKKFTTGGLSVLQSINIFRSSHRLSDDSIFTTVDICEIDKKSGVLSFYKAGAYDSFHIHGNEISLIKGGGMPIGLCERDKIRHCTLQIQSGDFIVMASDGLSVFNDELETNILECKNDDPKCFAEQLLRKMGQYSHESTDDVTVMVCKFINDTEE